MGRAGSLWHESAGVATLTLTLIYFCFAGPWRHPVPGEEQGGEGRDRRSLRPDRHGQISLPGETAARVRHSRGHHQAGHVQVMLGSDVMVMLRAGTGLKYNQLHGAIIAQTNNPCPSGLVNYIQFVLLSRGREGGRELRLWTSICIFLHPKQLETHRVRRALKILLPSLGLLSDVNRFTQYIVDC